MLVVVVKGRSLTVGKVVFAGFIGNASVAVCPVWLSALYLFVRYIRERPREQFTDIEKLQHRQRAVQGFHGRLPRSFQASGLVFHQALAEIQGVTYSTQNIVFLLV